MDTKDLISQLNAAIAGHVLARNAALHGKGIADINFKPIERDGQEPILALYAGDTLLCGRPDNDMIEMARSLVQGIDKYHAPVQMVGSEQDWTASSAAAKLGRMKTAKKAAAAAANGFKPGMVPIEKIPCTCGRDPHLSACRRYQTQAKRASRARMQQK